MRKKNTAKTCYRDFSNNKFSDILIINYWLGQTKDLLKKVNSNIIPEKIWESHITYSQKSKANSD